MAAVGEGDWVFAGAFSQVKGSRSIPEQVGDLDEYLPAVVGEASGSEIDGEVGVVADVDGCAGASAT
jgi:hypothetical protein